MMGISNAYKMWKNYIPNCIFVLGVISDKDETSEFIKRCKNCKLAKAYHGNNHSN